MASLEESPPHPVEIHLRTPRADKPEMHPVAVSLSLPHNVFVAFIVQSRFDREADPLTQIVSHDLADPLQCSQAVPSLIYGPLYLLGGQAFGLGHIARDDVRIQKDDAAWKLRGKEGRLAGPVGSGKDKEFTTIQSHRAHHPPEWRIVKRTGKTS